MIVERVILIGYIVFFFCKGIFTVIYPFEGFVFSLISGILLIVFSIELFNYIFLNKIRSIRNILILYICIIIDLWKFVFYAIANNIELSDLTKYFYRSIFTTVVYIVPFLIILFKKRRLKGNRGSGSETVTNRKQAL